MAQDAIQIDIDDIPAWDGAWGLFGASGEDDVLEISLIDVVIATVVV